MTDNSKANLPGPLTGQSLWYWFLTAIFLVGIPGLFGYFLLDHLEKAHLQEGRKREQDDIREVLGQIAVRGSLQRRFANQLDRLTQLAWTLPGFAARLAQLQQQNSGIIDLYLFNAAGIRHPLPGIPDQLVFASQQFLKTLLNPEKPVSEKLLRSFAGNGGAAGLMSASPGTMVELLNGGKNTWGGWYAVKDRHAKTVGHLIVFVHRQAMEPSRLLDKAIEETNRLTRGRFVCGWRDPIFPDTLNPRGRSFPSGLGAHLQSISLGESVSEWNQLPLALFLTDEGELLFGCSVRPLQASEFFAACRWYLLLLLGAGFSLLFLNLHGMRSLRTKLIWQFAIAGGFPLAVFLSTVIIDRQDRELLLEKQICDNHLEFLTRLDGGYRSEFIPALRSYKRFFRATQARPELLVPAHAEFLHREIQKQRGLTTRCTVATRDGKILFFHQYDPAKPGGIRKMGAQEALPFAALNVLQNVNLEAPGTAAAGLTNPIMGLMVTTKYAPGWLDEDGLLKANQMAKETVLSYFKLYKGSRDSYQAILMATHDSRIGQIQFLRRLLHRKKIAKPDSSVLFAVPVIPGGRWPSFPDEHMSRNPMVRKMRDLVLTGALPQHQPMWLEGRKYLVSALRGNFLDGYILMLARPYASIYSRTRVLATRAGFIAGFMLFLALGIAWATARGLLEPLRELGEGLGALKERRFRHRVEPGALSELAVVAHRFNVVLEGLGELEMARSVQETLWPAQGLSGEGWSIQGRCVTASELGGDYYDWIVLADGRLVLAVGDVAGHGIPSALVAASAKVELAMNTETESDPARVLAAMNTGLMKQAGRKRPMSFWLGIFDPGTRQLTYSNAGQNYPLAMIPGEAVKMIEGKGYPLGSRMKSVFSTGKVDFRKGGRLFVYSDGIVEARAPGGEPFDYSRLVDLAGKSAGTPLETSIRDIFLEVHAWSGRPVPEDDQTLVILDIEATA